MDKKKKIKICIVAAVPRSGSTMLCDILKQNYQVIVDKDNSDYEFFVTGSNFLKYFLFNPVGKGIRKIVEKEGKDDVVFLKIHINSIIFLFRLYNVFSYTFFLKKMLKKGLVNFEGINFIRVYREDLISSAVSYYIASRTGIWNSFKKENINNVKYNFNKIYHYYLYINKLNNLWGLFFEGQKIKPLEIEFKELINNRLETIEKINHYLSIDIRKDTIPNTVKMSSNPFSQDFVKRFTVDLENKKRPSMFTLFIMSFLRKSEEYISFIFGILTYFFCAFCKNPFWFSSKKNTED